MDILSTHHIIEGIGWLAVLFKLGTFSAQSMIPLRLWAMASSICFIAYSAVFQIWPLLVVEFVLLPMNAYRLYGLIAMRRLVTHMTDDTEPDFSAAMSYGKKHTLPKGSVIFKKGDPVNSLYYLAEGTVAVEDQNITIEPGSLFGEMAFFNKSAERSATLRSINDVTVYEMNEKRFTRLQYEDPKFAMSVMRLVTQRLVANAAQPKE